MDSPQKNPKNPKNSDPYKLPIAETFTSIHGEGFWAGTRMTFFRTAGCNVGRVLEPTSMRAVDFPILPTGKQASVCTTFDGREFPCDTDYNKTEMVELDDLINRIPEGVRHVCITGGEPFLHQTKLCYLTERLRKRHIRVHFETSGTIALPDWTQDNHTWIVCSPKDGYLKSNLGKIDELRIMVDKGLKGNLSRFYPHLKLDCKIFLSPISSPTDVTKLDPDSLQRCLELIGDKELSSHDVRISIQMHKILNVR